MRLSPWLFLPVAALIAAAPLLAHTRIGSSLAQALQKTGTEQVYQRPQASRPAASSLQAVYQRSVASAVRVNVGDSGTGSGFFISADGLIMTAAHVVLGEPGASFTVDLTDGRRLPATVVGYDERRDLALLRVRGGGYSALKLAPQAAQVGDATVAIGNSRGAFDGGRAGRVTALNASGQLDASFAPDLTASSMPLAPGDSGGPVLNTRGEVVGVSDAVSQGEAGFSSYFVPLTTASPIVSQLRAGLRLGVPVLGVTVADARQALGTPGVLVTGVQPGLGAARAGLRAASLREFRDESGGLSQSVGSADVIVAVDGRAVRAPDDLIAYLRSKRAGDTVTLRVQRDGQPLTLRVQLSQKRA